MSTVPVAKGMDGLRFGATLSDDMQKGDRASEEHYL